MDDCLTGADTVERAIETQQQLQELISKAKFLLRKWNLSSPAVLESIPAELHDSQASLTISDTYDVLGWFAPAIIKVKILLQRLWESKVDWDDPIPKSIKRIWSQWCSQLKLLSRVHIPRYYFPKDIKVASLQLHGFCDVSVDAYSGVVYLRMEDTNGDIHVALLASKTHVAPIKQLSIPGLEL